MKAARSAFSLPQKNCCNCKIKKGIVNNEILWETPICSNFSMDNGIGALEDADENAKNIAGKNFL